MSSLIHKIPKVRGKLKENANIASSSWFKVGGPAELLFTPADELDLLNFFINLDSDIPIFVIGASSNILIRDGGIKGVVIKLGTAFNKINVIDDKLFVGAYVKNMILAKYARNNNLPGFNFLSGIPGTVGGSIKMNAGCYGREMSDIISKIKIIDRKNGFSEITIKNLNMNYRKSSLPDDSIIVSAFLKYKKKDNYKIINNIKEQRLKTQPINELTGGSTFKNPPGYKAWKLIDESGCRGLSIGGAKISDMHTNFIINYDNATANDIETLGNKVKEKVFVNSGIKLEWEILRVGF
jgi:UDP-N-acetylmuramate dehydrogenase